MDEFSLLVYGKPPLGTVSAICTNVLMKGPEEKGDVLIALKRSKVKKVFSMVNKALMSTVESINPLDL